MIDAHCHIDLYPHPAEVAARAERAGVVTVLVTNLPSAFDRAYHHVRGMKNIRIALGLHPLLSEQHGAEKEHFAELVEKTSYIGEVGLDFSRAGHSTRDQQLESFRFVLRTLGKKPKFISIHSRRAESAVLDCLQEGERSPAVFHWYSGPYTLLEQLVVDGHYFSINPAMIGSPNGKRIIEALPPDRVLTETDGPFTKVGARPAVPTDVAVVEQYLGVVWHMRSNEVSVRIRNNFRTLIQPMR